MTTRDYIDSKIIPIPRTRADRKELTRRDLLKLGVMALDTADRARLADDHVLAREYTALADKCDQCALETEEA